MNNPGKSLAIRASGMVTAVGFNAPASLAAMRAGIDGMAETNLWDSESGTFLNAGRVLLPHWWTGLGKLAELVAPAIYECLEAAHPVRPEDIPILLGVPGQDRRCRWEGLEDRILDEVEFKLGLKHHYASRVVPMGRVSGAYSLGIAKQLIESQQVHCCIVAGVDSFVDQKVVQTYLERRRILTPVNSNGFTPGEAGSAVLVVPFQKASGNELVILGVGTAREKATIESEHPIRGDGMVQAVREALSQANCSLADTAYRITDINGEHYKFKEATFVVNRLLQERKSEPLDLWHPIEYIGEVGAAIVPCILAVALHAGLKGYAPGQTALCHVGNDGGDRAAVVVKLNIEGR